MSEQQDNFLKEQLLKVKKVKIRHPVKYQQHGSPTKPKLIDKDVGFNIGFNSADYFSIQTTGKTPQQYSQMKRAQNN